MDRGSVLVNGTNHDKLHGESAETISLTGSGATMQTMLQNMALNAFYVQVYDPPNPVQLFSFGFSSPGWLSCWD